LRRLEPEEL